MNKLLILFFIPLCIACKKEEAAEPLVQLHFINFVNEAGQNVFESNSLPTSEFYYVYGDHKVSWEEIMAGKQHAARQFNEMATYKHREALATLFGNNSMLLEDYQGNLERERVVMMNGGKHVFRYSLKDGFYQNGTTLEYSTQVIDKYKVYLHEIVLKEF